MKGSKAGYSTYRNSEMEKVISPRAQSKGMSIRTIETWPRDTSSWCTVGVF